MPMKSQAQRAFLWMKHPHVAREFEAKTPQGEKLPERLHPKKQGERKRYEAMVDRRK